jgi:type I restriction enzyme R subunit
MVRTTMKDVLDELPRAYTKDLYERKCNTICDHFYEPYLGQGEKRLYGA